MVEAYGQEALTIFKQLPEGIMPFLWTVLWPLIGTALTKKQVNKSIEYAKKLLDPKQKRLPDALTNKIEKAIAYWRADQKEKAHASLKESLMLAEESAYI